MQFILDRLNRFLNALRSVLISNPFLIVFLFISSVTIFFFFGAIIWKIFLIFGLVS